MQDLEVIERQNTAAVQRSIPEQTAAGKWVTALYAGLNFIDYRAFDNQKDQLAFGSQYVGDAPGNRVEYHNPEQVIGTPVADSASELPVIEG